MKPEEIIQHCASRLLAIATLKIFPNSKLGDGGSLKNQGFYYDFKLSDAIHEEDLEKLEEEMKTILKNGVDFIFKDQLPNFEQEPFKQKLVLKPGWQTIEIRDKNNQLLLEDIWKVREENFTKLDLTNFNLTEISGAFFENDSKNQQLIRISGVIGKDAQELETILQQIEIRKQSDHKIIGKNLNVFALNQYFGQGFIAWLEDGTKIRKKITEIVDFFEKKYDFDEVITPAFGHKELYEISGHWQHYRSSMFPVIELDNEKLVLRPMTCPHHIVLFKSRRYSYKELPKRFAEHSRFFRFEASGALSGLERVRGMELSDGHIFLRKNQIKDEIKNCFRMVQEILRIFKIQIDHVALSTRSLEQKFSGNDELWETSQNILKEIIQELNIPFQEEPGEAAFYGPKLDIQIKNFLGKILTISTIQLDFFLPEQFKTYFINEKGQKELCVMIHRGLVGTYERFISILLEQNKGFLPFWISPRQAKVIPIQNNHPEVVDYAKKVFYKLREANIEAEIDLSEDRINKKIMLANTKKFHFLILVGLKELENNKISVRKYNSKETQSYYLKEFIDKLIEQNKAF